MSLERLAEVLKIEYKGSGYFDYLVEHYKPEYGLNTARRKALEDFIFDRIETLVNMIERKGE